MRNKLPLLLFFFSPLCISAQALLSGYQLGFPDHFFVKVDRATCSLTVVDTLPPGISSIHQQSSFMHNGKYSFVGLEPDTDIFLYTLDGLTGATLSGVLLGNVLHGPRYYCGNDSVYSLQYGPSTSMLNFISVDPATGICTTLDSFPQVYDFGSGGWTLDPDNGRYFFTAYDTSNILRLYNIDVHTGNVISDPPIQGPGFQNMEYSCAAGMIYATHMDQANNWHVVSVDPVTAAYTIVGSMPSIGSVFGLSSTFDQQTGHYLFLGTTVSSTIQLISFSIQANSVVYSPVMNSSNSIMGMQLPACCVPAGINEPGSAPIRIYPNPASSTFTLEFPEADGMVRIYNSLGQEMMLVKTTQQHTTIAVENFPRGLYHVVVETESGVMRTSFVKE